MPRSYNLSWSQRELLSELPNGPQWEGGLKTQTFRALYRRGLVTDIERGELAYRWKLTAEGARLVLAEGIVQPRWLRQLAQRDARAGGTPGDFATSIRPRAKSAPDQN